MPSVRIEAARAAVASDRIGNRFIIKKFSRRTRLAHAVTDSSNNSGRDGGPGSGGAPDSGVAAIDSGTSTIHCSATLPTGSKTYTGANISDTADGLNYGIWTNGSGGSITVFPEVPL